MREYCYFHVKLFILAHAVKNHAILMAEGTFLSGTKCKTYWEDGLQRQFTPSMNLSINGVFIPIPEDDDYHMLLLAQIAVQYCSMEWARQATAFLAPKAVFPIRLALGPPQESALGHEYRVVLYCASFPFLCQLPVFVS